MNGTVILNNAREQLADEIFIALLCPLARCEASILQDDDMPPA